MVPVCDFANILFAGPCNRRCPFCIGRHLPDRVNVDNLDVFPLPGLDRFSAMVNRHRIRDVVFTGTVSIYRGRAAHYSTKYERVVSRGRDSRAIRLDVARGQPHCNQ